jgi:hypothetical protein
MDFLLIQSDSDNLAITYLLIHPCLFNFKFY